MLRELAHPSVLLGLALAVVVGLYVHDLAQTVVARLLGDRTALAAGFLRPGRVLLDPLGTVCAFLTVGAWCWAAPVPFDVPFRRLRGRAAAALVAGPLALFALAAAAAAGVRASSPLLLGVHVVPRTPDGLLTLGQAHGEAFVAGLAVGAAYALAGMLVTSLLPIPPLGLGRALWLYLPSTAGWQRVRYALQEDGIGSLVAFAILMLPLLVSVFPDVVGSLVGPVLRGLFALVGLRTA